MAFILYPDSFAYNLFFILSVLILILKLIITIYFGYLVYKHKKEIGKFEFNFTTGMFFLILCLFLFRLILIIYNFGLIYGDPANKTPLIRLFYAFGVFIQGLGYSLCMFSIDKSVLEFKFKGIFSYIVLGIGILYLFNQGFIVEMSLNVIYTLIAMMIPLLLFYVGSKNPKLKRPAYMISIGVILYAIAMLLLIASVLELVDQLWGSNGVVVLQIVNFVLKFIAIAFLTYGVLNFKL